MKYAVFQNGIRQYKVSEGEEILVDRIDSTKYTENSAKEKSIVFANVLLVSDGEKVLVGTPNVSGAKITTEVLGEQKGEKIEVVKYKAKSRYRKHTGHRHQYTKLKITKITS